MIHIIGGGLAGCEAAWQAASLGVRASLHEMRPVRATAVHKTDQLSELVCSNSLRGDKLDNAVGLLKEEMRRLGSLVMRMADVHRVPAGAALAVDRELFSRAMTGADHLYFYDAISPIVLAETIDMAKVFRASRWGRSLSSPESRVPSPEDGDYLNCPMTKDDYDRFYDAVISAESATVHDFDKEKFFEGCLPI